MVGAEWRRYAADVMQKPGGTGRPAFEVRARLKPLPPTRSAAPEVICANDRMSDIGNGYRQWNSEPEAQATEKLQPSLTLPALIRLRESSFGCVQEAVKPRCRRGRGTWSEAEADVDPAGQLPVA